MAVTVFHSIETLSSSTGGRNGAVAWVCGIPVTSLMKEPEQICLFSDPIRLEKEEKLFLAIEEIRRRFGKRAIYPAALMKDLKMPEYRDHGLIMPGVMNR